jgi:hypothetical protein
MSNAELFQNTKGVKPIDEQWATALQLAPLLKMSDKELRRLADVNNLNPETNAPWIPKPVRGKYNVLLTIAGVLAWHRWRAERRTDFQLEYPTMEAFSTATGISKNLLKEMKRDNCPGFHASGRIQLLAWLAGLEPWLSGKSVNDQFKLTAEGVTSWAEFREKYQALNEKIKNGDLLGTLVMFDAVTEVIQTAQAIFFGGLDRQSVDFPARLAGRDAIYVKRAVEKYDKELRRGVEREFNEIIRRKEAQLEAQRKQQTLVPA